MSEKPKIDPVVEELAQRLRDELGSRIRRIILYGSRSRGDFHPDSDYDVIVLVDKETEELRKRIRDLKLEIGFKHNALIFLLVHEASYFEEKRYEPLFINIRREGIRV